MSDDSHEVAAELPPVHVLKTHPEPFEAVIAGVKRAEFRRMDRPFKVGHLLRLREWDPCCRVCGSPSGEFAHIAFHTGAEGWRVDSWACEGGARGYTGRQALALVTHIAAGERGAVFGIPAGYGMLSIELRGTLYEQRPATEAP